MRWRYDLTAAVAAAIGAILLSGGTSQATVAPVAAGPASTWVTDGDVYAVAADASHFYLGGHFSLVGPPTGSGVSLDPASGARDAAFATVTGGAVRAVVDDGSGGYFIGGDFTRVAGVPRHGLAHILADGSLDTAWTADADRSVRALARVGSRLFVGGAFANIGGVVQPGLAAVDAAGGTVVASWRPVVSGPVNALVAAGGTTLYAGGEISAVNGVPRGFGAAFDVSTGALLSWDPHVEFRAIDALAVATEDSESSR